MTRVVVLLLGLSLFAFGSIGNVRAVDDDAQFSQEVRFREDFGLRTDPDLIRALMSDPSAYEGGYGVALTDDELADLRRRLAMEQAVVPLIEHAATLPSYAGHWIDQRAGGILNLALAQESADDRSALIALTPPDAQVQILQVAYTWRELESVRDRIREERISLREEHGIAITELGIDPTTNRVHIAVLELSEQVVEELGRRYGPSVIVEHAGVPTPTACNSRADCIGPPVRAGIAAGPGCSLGFLVKKSGVYGTQWLTAGHCAPSVGAAWQHNGVTIGWIRATCWPQCLYSEAARGGELNNTYASSSVYIDYIYRTNVVATEALTQNYVGVQTCLNARREPGDSGFRCGVVDEIRDVWYGEEIYYLDARYATYSAYNGDSGGAVHSPLNTNGLVTAQGIQSGCEDFTPPPNGVEGCETWEVNGRGIYTHIAHILSELGPGLTVCSNPTPCP